MQFNSIGNKAIGLLEGFENSQKPFSCWIAVIYVVAVLRAFLDSFLCNTWAMPFLPHIFLHVPLWNLNFLLSITLIVSILAGQKIQKTGKAVIALSPIFLLVPIIDFLVTGGEGIALHYAMNPQQAIAAFFSLGGLLGKSVVTPGQLIAGTAAMAFALYYTKRKSNSLKKGITAAFLIYFAGVLLGSYPIIVTGLLGKGPHYTIEVAFACYLFLALLASLQCLAVLFLYRKETAKTMLKSVRPVRIIHYLALTSLGAAFYYYYFPGTATNFVSLLASLFSVFFAFESCLAFNNLADKEMPGKIKKTVYQSTAIAMLLLSLAFAAVAGLIPLALMFIALMLGLNYSLPPMRLKRLGYLNNIAIGMISTLVLFTGYFSQGSGIPPMGLCIAFLFIFCLSSNVKDLKDREKDKRDKINTLPVLLGKKRGAWAIAALTSLSFPVIPLLLDFPPLLLPSLAIGLLNFFLLVKTKKEIVTFGLYFFFALLLGLNLLHLF